MYRFYSRLLKVSDRGTDVLLTFVALKNVTFLVLRLFKTITFGLNKMHNMNKETQFKNTVDRNRVQWNLSLRTLLYYGQFTWSLSDQNPYKAYSTSLKRSPIVRTLIPVPLVSVKKRFDCSYQGETPFVIFRSRVHEQDILVNST